MIAIQYRNKVSKFTRHYYRQHPIVKYVLPDVLVGLLMSLVVLIGHAGLFAVIVFQTPVGAKWCKIFCLIAVVPVGDDDHCSTCKARLAAHTHKNYWSRCFKHAAHYSPALIIVVVGFKIVSLAQSRFRSVRHGQMPTGNHDDRMARVSSVIQVLWQSVHHTAHL